MIYRGVVILVAVVAGVGVGAFVFKMVGEDRVGAEVKKLGARFGVQSRPGDSSALDLLERLAPGTSAGFQSAAIGAVLAATIATAAVTISVREIAP